jgi:hypothetical protein
MSAPPHVWLDGHGDLHGRDIEGATLGEQKERVYQLAMERALIPSSNTTSHRFGGRIIIEEPANLGTP